MFNKFGSVKQSFSRYGIYAILVLAAVLRFIKLRYVFYGPYGELYRDLNIVYDFVKLHHWPLLGPVASVGNFYFGPIYYYLITPFALAFGLAPYGAVFTSAFFSVLEVWVFYKLLGLWFGQKNVPAGRFAEQIPLLGALLLAVSVYDIQNAYYISNPTLLPFFILLFFYCLTLVLQNHTRWITIVGLGVGFSVAIQLHATALLFLPLVLLAVGAIKRIKLSWPKIVLFLATAVVAWLPYIFFEFQNRFANTYKIFHTGNSTFGWLPNLSSVSSLLEFIDRALIYQNGFYNFIMLHRTAYLLLLPLELIILLSLFLLFKKSLVPKIQVSVTGEGKLLALVWLATAVLMFLFYQPHLQHFYFLILWPLPVLFLTWLMAWLGQNYRKVFWVIFPAYLLLQGFQLPFFYQAVENRKFDHKKLGMLFSDIQKDAQDRRYNIINGSYDPNLFGYYLKLFEVKQKLARTNVTTLYYMKEAGSGDSLAALSADYQKIGELSEGGIVAEKYVKIQK
jgi:4-amino-4-deoxy-L-arabinose transferase-like glycosyltransferase